MSNWNNRSKNVSTFTKQSKNASTFNNQTKTLSPNITWAANLNTWAAELRTWAETIAHTVAWDNQAKN